METIIISENLKLTSISENNYKDGKIIAVLCEFDFFGRLGVAYITRRNLERDFPSYTQIEMHDELFDSFSELLDYEENWEKISTAVKQFIEDWEKNNKEE